MTYKFIKFEKKERVAYLNINKPPYNVLDIPTMKEMNDALDNVNKDENIDILVLGAEGDKAFSAGVDVSDHTEDKVDEMIEVFHGIFKRLNNFKGITIAAVKGAALGGGCEVAIFCDMIFAADNIKIGQPEIKLAVFPPIALLVLPKIIPTKKAFEIILGGEVIKSEEALNIGLVNKVVALDNFANELDKFISTFSSLSGSALKTTKEAFAKVKGLDFNEGLPVIEDIYLNKLMKLNDAEEGLKSFLEKRKPTWIHS
jgi:cyclohexa-1,5-dienecarbonyl-CoA hydratase